MMIRIRVVKAYELAVAGAALLLVAAIIALIATALSGGDAVTTGAPVQSGEQPTFGRGSATVDNGTMQEETAITVFSSSAVRTEPLFVAVTRPPLRVTGEVIDLGLQAQGEEIVDAFGARLPMEEVKLDMLDKLIKFLRI